VVTVDLVIPPQAKGGGEGGEGPLSVQVGPPGSEQQSPVSLLTARWSKRSTHT